MTDTTEVAKKHGFNLTNTGGGCTALEKVLFRNEEPRYQEIYLLITNEDDPSHPESLDDTVTVGLYTYTDDVDQSVILRDGVTLLDALKFCDGVRI